MPYVEIKEGEPFDVALRRFKRSCEREGIIAKLKEKEFYIKRTTQRKYDHISAIKRWKKKKMMNLPANKVYGTNNEFKFNTPYGSKNKQRRPFQQKLRFNLSALINNANANIKD